MAKLNRLTIDYRMYLAGGIHCDEFSFRYNNRDIKDNSRFILSLSKPEGRLKYKTLISNEPRKKEEYQKEESEWD